MEIKKNMGLINCTPHTVVVQGETADDGWQFEPSGILPRLETEEVPASDMWGIPCISRKMGQVVDLPAPMDGTVYIVSSLIFQACPDRQDLVVPDTGKSCIRENGRIVAVRQFVRRAL